MHPDACVEAMLAIIREQGEMPVVLIGYKTSATACASPSHTAPPAPLSTGLALFVHNLHGPHPSHTTALPCIALVPPLTHLTYSHARTGKTPILLVDEAGMRDKVVAAIERAAPVAGQVKMA